MSGKRLVFALWLLSAQLVRAEEQEAADLRPNDFAFGRSLEVLDSTQPLAAVSIPVDLYRDSRSEGLNDVSVWNGQGQQVPHALSREITAGAVPVEQTGTAVPFFPVSVQHAQAPLELSVTISRAADGQVLALQSHTKSDKPVEPSAAKVAAYLLDVRAVPQNERGLHAARFEWMDAPDNLILPLSIDTSEDLIAWQPLQVDGGLLNLSYAGQRIERDRVHWSPSKAAFLRVRPQSLPSFPAQLRAARVEAVPTTLEPERERVAVKAGQGSNPAKGVYRFDLGAEIPVEEVEVELPEDNSVIAGELWSAQRADGPYQRLSQARFYRVLSQGKPLTGPRLRVFRQRVRFYELRVDRSRMGLGTGTPILATYHTPEQLLFLLRGAGPFMVAYGRHLVHRQRFEPEELLGLLPPQPDGGAPQPARARLGEKRDLGGPGLLVAPRPEVPYKTYALWAVLILGVGMLGLLAYRLARSET
jgi:hypothetical protein